MHEAKVLKIVEIANDLNLPLCKLRLRLLAGQYNEDLPKVIMSAVMNDDPKTFQHEPMLIMI